MSPLFSRIYPSLKARPFFGALLAIVITLFLLFLFFAVSESPEKSELKKTPWKVAVLPVVFNDSGHVDVRLYGQVESPRLTLMTADSAAYVEQVQVLSGHRVNKGDLLVQLDQRDLTLQLQQRKADETEVRARLASENLRFDADRKALTEDVQLFERARREYERLKSLEKQKLTSISRTEAAQGDLGRQQLQVIIRQQNLADHQNRSRQLTAQFSRAEALRMQAELALERSTFTAPFDGWVTRVDVSAGERVRQGDTVVELYPASSVEIRAQIPDHYLSSTRHVLQSGQPLLAMTGEGQSLMLNRLASYIDQGRGGLDGFFRQAFNNPEDIPLALGRPLAITLSIPVQKPVVRISPRMLYEDTVVYRVAEDNTLQAVEVNREGSVIVEGQEYLQISSDELQAGDKLLETRLANAITGLEVSVAMKEPLDKTSTKDTGAAINAEVSSPDE